MAFVVGYGVSFIGALVAYNLSKNKSKKENTLFGVFLLW